MNIFCVTLLALNITSIILTRLTRYACLCYKPNSKWCHYSDVTMSAMASQITGVSMVCSNVCSGADQRKHQSYASLAFVTGIHRWPANSPREGPVVSIWWRHHVVSSSKMFFLYLGVIWWLSTNPSRMLGDKWIQLYMSPTRRQAINWTNADLLPKFDPQEYTPVKFETKWKYLSWKYRRVISSFSSFFGGGWVGVGWGGWVGVGVLLAMLCQW